eukprot:3656852-Rhodomonas_salina.1
MQVSGLVCIGLSQHLSAFLENLNMLPLTRKRQLRIMDFGCLAAMPVTRMMPPSSTRWRAA